jgi:2-amino-4-hydroxy-6-hydroxymethyldihydropteridine diphosphokinase
MNSISSDNNNHGTYVMLSLGANLGHRRKSILEAIWHLADNRIISDLKISSFYETEPVGYSQQPWFLNIVITGQTNFSLEHLIELCKSIEYSLGRTPNDIKWQARIIDIDIIFYGQTSYNNDRISIPHPRMHERKFVLLPAFEIAANTIHPGFGKTIETLLEECSDKSVVNCCA